MSEITKLQELQNKINDLNKDIKTINDHIERLQNPVEKVKLYQMKSKKHLRVNNLVNKVDFIILG